MGPFRALTHSTNLAGAEADGDDLLITFKSGATYRYPGAAGHLDDLVRSRSPGKYLSEYLKGTGEERV